MAEGSFTQPVVTLISSLRIVLDYPAAATLFSSTHSDDGIRMLADEQPPLPFWQASSGPGDHSVSPSPARSVIDLHCNTTHIPVEAAEDDPH